MAAGIAALGALLSGRAQGQQQADLYRQQLQQRQLEEQLQSQELMAKLKSQQADESALSALPKEAQPYARLGLYGEYQKQKQAGLTGEFGAGGYEAMAAQEKDPNKAAILKYAAAMEKANVPQPMIKDFLDRNGLKPPSEAGANSDFAQYKAAHPGMGFDEAYSRFKALGREPKESGGEKFLDKLVSDTGPTIITPSGDPWPNPAATRRDAFAAGGIAISDKARDALNMNIEADRGLDDMLASGKNVLPGAPSTFGAYVNPLTLAARRAGGDRDVADFDATRIDLIKHLRSVAGIARVNPQELAQINKSLSDANSYPALEAAVRRAQSMLRRSRPNLVKAGKLTLPADNPSGGGGSAPSPGGRVRLPSGMYYDPKDGKAYTNP